MEIKNPENVRVVAPDNVQQGTKNTMSMRKFITFLVILLVVFVAALLYDRSDNSGSSLQNNLAVDGNKTTTAAEGTVMSVSDKVSPSVVSIITSVTQQSYFGTTSGEAAGTGIIVSSDGYILTNKHVVSDAKSVQVVTSDGTAYDSVTVLGVDPLNDVAFLKIKDATGLPAVTLGDSSTVRVGQNVVTIGNALGQYQNTVTSGIISGLGRPVQAGDSNGSSTESLTDLFQTDASINPGNSGGPLLNMAGQVIGINTAIAQDAQGIGFSIPINATKGMLKNVLAGKGVQRSYIGVRYIEITADVAKKYNLPVKQGAYVFTENSVPIVGGSPAEKAGIKEKDIITKINGLAVGKNGGVSSMVGAYAPGDSITVTILRDGREQELRVILGVYSAN